METLKKFRKAKGLTQEQIAKKLGIGRTAYTAYEIGANKPPIEKLMQLADIFDCSVDDLIGNEKSAIPTGTAEMAQLILSLPDDKRKQAIDFILYLKDKK